MVSRPPTPGGTVRDMAAGYATVLDRIGAEATLCDERVDLLGLSMGGFVAGELAASQPERVGRLVFGLAAARLSDEGGQRSRAGSGGPRRNAGCRSTAGRSTRCHSDTNAGYSKLRPERTTR